MSGFFLLVPFLLVRFGLLFLLNRAAIKRAAHFAPMPGKKIFVYWAYQILNLVLFVSILFLKVIIEPSWPFYAGIAVYSLGLVLCVISIINFAFPSSSGLNCKGIYRFSRNPMYLSYFLYFMGCALLTQSFMMLVPVFAFQIMTHWIILSEEKWCTERFGEAYLEYMKRVRRYIG